MLLILSAVKNIINRARSLTDSILILGKPKNYNHLVICFIVKRIVFLFEYRLLVVKQKRCLVPDLFVLCLKKLHCHISTCVGQNNVLNNTGKNGIIAADRVIVFLTKIKF